MKYGILFSLVVMAGQASGQYFDRMFFIGWTVNTPVANQEFVGSPTARGARFGYRKMITPKLAGGIDLTLATYDQYIPRQTYYNPGNTLTTDYTRLVNTYGATLSLEYLFRQEKRLMPYAGLGAGVAYNSYKIFYNVFSNTDNVFGFLARPRVGAWFRFSERRSWAINTSFHVEYSTTKSEQMGYDYFLNPGFEIGVVLLDW